MDPKMTFYSEDGQIFDVPVDKAEEFSESVREEGLKVKSAVRTTPDGKTVHEINPWDAEALKKAKDAGETIYHDKLPEVNYWSMDAVKEGFKGMFIDPTGEHGTLAYMGLNLASGIGTAAGKVLGGIAKGAVDLVGMGAAGLVRGVETLGNAALNKNWHGASDTIRKGTEAVDKGIDFLTPDYFALRGMYDGIDGAAETMGGINNLVEMGAGLAGIGGVAKGITAAAKAAKVAKAAQLGHVGTAAGFGLGKYEGMAADENGPRKAQEGADKSFWNGGNLRQETAALGAGIAEAVTFGVLSPFGLMKPETGLASPFVQRTRAMVAKEVLKRMGKSGALMGTVAATKEFAEAFATVGTDSVMKDEKGEILTDEQGHALRFRWNPKSANEVAKTVMSEFVVGSMFPLMEFTGELGGSIAHRRALKKQGSFNGINENMKVAMTYQVEKNREAYCPFLNAQAEQVAKIRASGIPVSEGLPGCQNVKEVLAGGEVLFDDGSVWRPARAYKMRMAGVDAELRQEGATITVADGTILDAATGKLIGFAPRGTEFLAVDKTADERYKDVTPESDAAEVSRRQQEARQNVWQQGGGDAAWWVGKPEDLDFYFKEKDRIAAENAIYEARRRANPDSDAKPNTEDAMQNVWGEGGMSAEAEAWLKLTELSQSDGDAGRVAKMAIQDVNNGNRTLVDAWKGAKDALGITAQEEARKQMRQPEGKDNLPFEPEAVEPEGFVPEGENRAVTEAGQNTPVFGVLGVVKAIDEGRMPIDPDCDISTLETWSKGIHREMPKGDADAKIDRPVVVFVDSNGDRVLVAGRKRLMDAKARGDKTIPAAYVRADQGWDLNTALGIDALENMLQGKATDAEQIYGLDALQVRSWEDAEMTGLATFGPDGRYHSQCDRAIRIQIHGTYALKEAVRSGRISGELADEMIAKLYYSFDNEQSMFREKLTDGILERSRQGGEEFARRLLEKAVRHKLSNKEKDYIGKTLDRFADEVRLEMVKEGSPDMPQEIAEKVATEPVETEKGEIKTVPEAAAEAESKRRERREDETDKEYERRMMSEGSERTPENIEDARDVERRAMGEESEEINWETADGSGPGPWDRMPETPYDAWMRADRIESAQLKPQDDGLFRATGFPSVKADLTKDGLMIEGLTVEDFTRHDKLVDLGAFIKCAFDKSKGKPIVFVGEDAEDIRQLAQNLYTQIQKKGFESVSAKMHERRMRLLGRLAKTGLASGVTTDLESWNAAMDGKQGELWSNSRFENYGCVTPDGVIHLNPGMFDVDTPIHEYGHLALEAMRGINPRLLERGLQLVKGEKIYQELSEDEIYGKMSEEKRADEALTRIIEKRGVGLAKKSENSLKVWLKQFWHEFKNALGIADLQDKDVDKMTVGEIADAIASEIFRGKQFGRKRGRDFRKASITSYDEDQGSGSNGIARWWRDNGRVLFKIPVDRERTQPGGKIVFKTDDANITDWIQNRLNGYTLILSKSGKIRVKGMAGLPKSLADIFGYNPTEGMNDGLLDRIASEIGNPAYADMTPGELVEALGKDRANYNAWLDNMDRGGSLEDDRQADHYRDAEEREAFEQRTAYEDKGFTTEEYIIDRIENEGAADREWEEAKGDIQSGIFSQVNYIKPFTPSNLQKAEPGDIIHFDHEQHKFRLAGYDPETGEAELWLIDKNGNEADASKVYRVSEDGISEALKGETDGQGSEEVALSDRNRDAGGKKTRGAGESFRLEAATAEEIEAEQLHRRQQEEIARRLAAPLKTGTGEVGQGLFDLGGLEGEDLFNRVERNAGNFDSGIRVTEEGFLFREDGKPIDNFDLNFVRSLAKKDGKFSVRKETAVYNRGKWRLSGFGMGANQSESGRIRDLVEHTDRMTKLSRANVKSWASNFPNVLIQTTRGKINRDFAADFSKAKGGSVPAAVRLVKSVVKPEKVKQLARQFPGAIVVPVRAEEVSGRNRLPLVYATMLTDGTGLKLDDGIMQSVRANHTGASKWHRFLTRAQFEGDVKRGAKYILVDDHITQGGTISELRHFIENKGGKVVAVTTLTASHGSTIIPVREATLDKLRAKYAATGKALQTDSRGDQGSPSGHARRAQGSPQALARAERELNDLLRRADIAGNVHALTEGEAQYILQFTPEHFKGEIERWEKGETKLSRPLKNEDKRFGEIVDKFGTTDDFADALMITPEGRMISSQRGSIGHDAFGVMQLKAETNRLDEYFDKHPEQEDVYSELIAKNLAAVKAEMKRRGEPDNMMRKSSIAGTIAEAELLDGKKISINDAFRIADEKGNDAGILGLLKSGGIRLASNKGGIEIAGVPNDRQIDIIYDYIDWQRENNPTRGYSVDMHIEGREEPVSVYYNVSTPASKVLGDIREFYSTGAIKEDPVGWMREFLKRPLAGEGAGEEVFKADRKAHIADYGMENTPGGLASQIEKGRSLRPWTTPGSPCANAKPIAFDAADLVMFWRKFTGAKSIPKILDAQYALGGRSHAIGVNWAGGYIEEVARIFGVLDQSDVEIQKKKLVEEGYFLHEKPEYRAAMTRDEIKAEMKRSNDALNEALKGVYEERVKSGKGGMHYATEVLAHEIGHSIHWMGEDADVGIVLGEARNLLNAMTHELRIKEGKGERQEIENLIGWWHGTGECPKYYEKARERFAELFGIFLTQPESVHERAPRVYDTCVKLIGKNPRLAEAYRTLCRAKWDGGADDMLLKELEKTWDKDFAKNLHKLEDESRKESWKTLDEFNYALNDRFGPMFSISERGLKKLRSDMDREVAAGLKTREMAQEIVKSTESSINSLRSGLYDFQRLSGGEERLMVSGFNDVIEQAKADGVNWFSVRRYAHLMRVIELGGRATAHAISPARAAKLLDTMKERLGDAEYAKVEKTWKAFRAIYERFILDDERVMSMFNAPTQAMLRANTHYVTMRHTMNAEELAAFEKRQQDFQNGVEGSRDPSLDIYLRIHHGLGGMDGISEGGYHLHSLKGSFDATLDPIAETIRKAIEIKRAAVRNDLIRKLADTLTRCGVEDVRLDAPQKVRNNKFGTLVFMDAGKPRRLILPRLIERCFTAEGTSNVMPGFGEAMRGLRNTMTLWNPSFINRAYLLDKAALETNLKGMHKSAISVISDALMVKIPGINLQLGLPLYAVDNYLARFTGFTKTWIGKILYNEHTVNYYARQAQQIASIVYNGSFSRKLAEARDLRAHGETSRAAEIEENVAVATEMLKRNVFQSQYEFNKLQKASGTDDIMQIYGLGQEDKAVVSKAAKAWEKIKSAARAWNRYEEEQEAVTKIIAWLYDSKTNPGRDDDARARLVIEQGGTPNLAARGILASRIENATGFFWNVRKEAFLRTWRAFKDHPTEWAVKAFAQTIMPTVIKELAICGGIKAIARHFIFNDDDKAMNESALAPLIEYYDWEGRALRNVPAYQQRNYNVIPLWTPDGGGTFALRVKWAPEEFAAVNAVHMAMQRLLPSPTDPDADPSTAIYGVVNEILPDISGENPAAMWTWGLLAPFIGLNPRDNFRDRNLYSEDAFLARWTAPKYIGREMMRNTINYSPIGSLVQTIRDPKDVDRNIKTPPGIDALLNGCPILSKIPASFLGFYAEPERNGALAGMRRLDRETLAKLRLQAGDVLSKAIERGTLKGADADILTAAGEVDGKTRGMIYKFLIAGWRKHQRAVLLDQGQKMKRIEKGIKTPEARRMAHEYIQDAMETDD